MPISGILMHDYQLVSVARPQLTPIDIDPIEACTGLRPRKLRTTLNDKKTIHNAFPDRGFKP